MAFFTIMCHLDEDHAVVSFTCPLDWAMEWPDTARYWDQVFDHTFSECVSEGIFGGD